VDAYGKDARSDIYSDTQCTKKKYIHETSPNNHGRASIRRVPFLYKAIPPETSLVDVRRAGADQSGVQSGVLHAA